MTESSPLTKIQAAGMSLTFLYEQLSSLAVDAVVELQLDQPLDGIAAGLSQPLTLNVRGSVGDYACLLSEQVDLDVSQDAGVGCGHSMVSGSILVHGSAGDCLGAFATGGFIAVHGHARHRCGLGLSGADVFVRSSVGDEAGCEMKDGALVLGNGAGKHLGRGMTGGIIYVRGEVKSVAEQARLMRMKDAEALRLGLFLARAGIKGGGSDFKVFRAKQESR